MDTQQIRHFILREERQHQSYIEQITFTRMRQLTLKATKHESKPYDFLKVLQMMQ